MTPTPKPLSEWTCNDIQDALHGAFMRMHETGAALYEIESVFRKLEASEKPLLDCIFAELKKQHPSEPVSLLEKLARASDEYRKFLVGERGTYSGTDVVGGLALIRRDFVKARHAHEMAIRTHESLRTLAASHREERRAGG